MLKTLCRIGDYKLQREVSPMGTEITYYLFNIYNGTDYFIRYNGNLSFGVTVKESDEYLTYFYHEKLNKCSFSYKQYDGDGRLIETMQSVL